MRLTSSEGLFIKKKKSNANKKGSFEMIGTAKARDLQKMISSTDNA